MRRGRRMWLIAPALLVLFVVVVLAAQRRVLFPGAAPRATAASTDPIADHETLRVESPEGIVEAWFLPGDAVTTDRPGPAVIFAHGNAELIDDWPSALAGYQRMGISVLLPEFRGYGRSAGAPSQRAIVDDFVAFYDQLVARPDVDARRIVFHGRSLGGGVVVALAARRPPAALILMSTFTSVPEMAKRWHIPSFLLLDPFESEVTLRSLHRPTLVLHGREDTLVPPSHAERLAEAAGGNPVVFYDAGHNDCPPDWEQFFEDAGAFLRSAGVVGR